MWRVSVLGACPLCWVFGELLRVSFGPSRFLAGFGDRACGFPKFMVRGIAGAGVRGFGVVVLALALGGRSPRFYGLCYAAREEICRGVGVELAQGLATRHFSPGSPGRTDA